MTTILFYLFVLVWVSFISFFVYLFIKNDYDLDKVKESIFKPKDLKVKENVNIEDIVDMSDINNNLNTTVKMLDEDIEVTRNNKKSSENDCEHAGGLLLNICDKKEYSKEERLLRGKILDRLKRTPTYFKEDGIDKLIVPLEIMVFLNNDLNPLVSENGEIVLALEKKESEPFLIKDKETGDTLFKSEAEQEIAINALKSLSEELNLPVEDLADSFREKLKEKTNTKEEKVVMEKTVKKGSKPITKEKEEQKNKIEAPEHINDDLLEDLLDDEDITEVKIDTNLLEESLEDELDELIIEDELKSNKKETENKIEEDMTIKDFLHGRKWAEGENMTINWKEITDNIVNSLSNINNKNAFLNNIIKQAPLVTNDNKTAIFIDLKILHNSFAKLFGNDSEVLIKKLMRMPAKISDSYKRGIEISLEEDISDLSIDTKRISTAYFMKDEQNFKSIGLWLKMDTFKQILSDDEFDFFRHYIYNEGFKPGVQSKNAKPLIFDINRTVI